MKPSRDIPDDLLGVAETLEDHRPQLSGLDADRIKMRAMAHGAKPATHTSTKGMFMRSRLAITSLLAFGLLLTGSGAALGVSALTVTGSASQAQYGQGAVLGDRAQGGGNDVVIAQPNGGVLGDEAQGGAVLGDKAEGGAVLGDKAEGGDVAGTTAGGGADAPVAAAQAPRQLESGQGAELPFTGYAAIPTLLIGIGLLAMGLILRRRPSHPTA